MNICLIRRSATALAVGALVASACSASAETTSTVPLTSIVRATPDAQPATENTTAQSTGSVPTSEVVVDTQLEVSPPPTTSPPPTDPTRSTEPQTPPPPPPPPPTDPATTPTPRSNTAPVLDTIEMRPNGSTLTARVQASDADGDDLMLTFHAVDPSTDTTHDFVVDGPETTFEVTFDDGSTGRVDVLFSASDGTDTVFRTETITVAPLAILSVSAGSMTASSGCFTDVPELTFQPGDDIWLTGGSSRGSDQTTIEALRNPLTLGRGVVEEYVFAGSIEEPFHPESGFSVLISLDGTIGNVPINFLKAIDTPGLHSDTFTDPTNRRCWVEIGFSVSTSDTST